MSDHALGFILLFVIGFGGGPLDVIVTWALRRLGGVQHPPAREPHHATVFVPSPPAAPRAHIERLSPAQRRRLSEWIASWSRLRIDDGTGDHRSVEGAIARVDERADQARVRFVWVPSPRAALAAGARAEAEPREQAEQPGIGTTARPRDRPHHLYWYPQLGAPRIAPLIGEIRRELERAGSAFQLMSAVSAALQGPSPSRAHLWYGTSGAFGDFFPYVACCRHVLALQYDDLASKALDLRMLTARCFGWWWPRAGVCVVSERPAVVHLDERGRLHHPSQAAVRFRDGFSVFIWRGINVPESWITSPEMLGPQEALSWPDRNQRRAAVEIMGWKRVLGALQVRTIDTDADPTVGQLVEADLPQIGPARFLRVRCGTGREFVLAVPRGVTTALEANAWTYSLSPAQYQLEVRT